ncbi:MmgE/PrpD family protein [Roseovarius indicus]|uniref:MmgE/PrpD family protein n=2 Tax=Roseovarius indicus TaxID=540747 RepID=UPI0007DA13DA|nr:MmgE/PrpD family protein [Roseovarius indicus]OAN98727.1 hypothetical protein A8B76_00125 [Roseovarius indicus]
MTPLTQQAAEFIVGLRFEDIPDRVARLAVNGITDCVATILLGATEPVTQVVSSCAIGTPGNATVLWGKTRCAAESAALINATASHSLDYDDTGLEGHPSAVLFPPILALGDEIGTSGRDILTAYVAGYEVWAELLFRDADQLHARGFHPTGVLGTVAAAAACAKLLKLDVNETCAALSASASMASGLTANFGSMTKPYQLGRAAQNGVTAARLARAGLTAAPDALEHDGGLIRAFSPNGKIDRERPAEFGKRLWIEREGLNIKLHPVCYAAHRSVQSALSLASKDDVSLEGLREIRVNIGADQSGMLRVRSPETLLEAKFCAEFCVSAALLSGRLGLAELSSDYVTSGVFASLAEKIVRIETTDKDPEQTLFSPFDRVDLIYENGSERRGDEIRYAFGHARNPVAIDQLRAKFEECVAGQLNTSKSSRLFDRLQVLTTLDDVRSLYDL